jgi:hypothetical protein
MAVIAYIDSLDLVVEPHELTDEDCKAFERFIEESRKRPETAEYTAKAMQLLRERGVLSDSASAHSTDSEADLHRKIAEPTSL